MLTQETLVRMRPWLALIFLLAVGMAFVTMSAVLLNPYPGVLFVQGLLTSAVLGGVALCAWLGVAYAQRRGRTWPAVAAISLDGAAGVLALGSVWGAWASDFSLLVVVTCGVAAVCWSLILGLYSLRLPVSLALVRHLTAAALAGLGITLALTVWRGPEDEPSVLALAVIGPAALCGTIATAALAHHCRAGLRALVPMAQVASVPRAMDYYRRLGFRCENHFAPPDAAEPTWAWLESPGGAQLMLTRACEPVVAAQQAVLFYLYCEDLPAEHERLAAAGLSPGPIERPFYAPRGEFRLTDPDGYALMMTHA